MVITVHKTGAKLARRHALELDKGQVASVYETLTEMVAHSPAREYSEVECSLTLWTRRDEDVPTNSLVDGPVDDARYTFGLRARRLGDSKFLTVVAVQFEKCEMESRELDAEEVTVTAEASVERTIKWRGGSALEPLKIALYYLREYDLDSDWSVKKAVNRVGDELKGLLKGEEDVRVGKARAVTGYDGLLERWLCVRDDWMELNLIRRVQELGGRVSLYGVRLRFPTASLERYEE